MDSNEKKAVFKELKNDILEYLELRTELIKLSLIEITAKATTSLVSAISLMVLFIFFLFFLFLALGFYLGDLLGSPFKGFGIIALFYMILIILFILIKKKNIEQPLTDKIIENLTQQNEQDK